jgi:hemerythrin-like metal-binding protein
MGSRENALGEKRGNLPAGRIIKLIREFREAAEVKAADAARDTGIPLRVYEKYEAGDSGIPIGVLYRMAKCFGVDCRALLASRKSRMSVAVVYRAGNRIEIMSDPPPGFLAGDGETPDAPGPGEEEEEILLEEGGGKGASGGKEAKGPERTGGRIYWDGSAPASEKRILEWQRAYSTGIGFFDVPHKEFVSLTNDLYAASKGGWEYSRAAFMQMIRYAVQYSQRDLVNEEKIMERVGYPEYKGHKREHAFFRKEVLSRVYDLKVGREVDIKNFVLFLRDWILSHVGISDRGMSLYLAKLKREGELGKIIIQVKKDAEQRLIIR